MVRFVEQCQWSAWDLEGILDLQTWREGNLTPSKMKSTRKKDLDWLPTLGNVGNKRSFEKAFIAGGRSSSEALEKTYILLHNIWGSVGEYTTWGPGIYTASIENGNWQLVIGVARQNRAVTCQRVFDDRLENTRDRITNKIFDTKWACSKYIEPNSSKIYLDMWQFNWAGQGRRRNDWFVLYE